MLENTPFFIVGSSRSGTTLLRLILTGHPRIHIPPETWFLLPLAKRFSLEAVLSENEAAEVIEIITEHRRWPDMGIDRSELVRWTHQLDAPRLVDIVDYIYQHHLKISGKVRFGDKTPPYINIIPELSTLYKGAKFIHLIRDGRDVAISFIDANFHPRAYHGVNFEWIKAVRHSLSYRNSSYSSNILEVRYEDLVADLEGVVKKICFFLGEEFEPQMLNWSERIEMVPGRERGIHKKLDKPIPSDAVAVWRGKLSPLECFFMEASLHRDLRQLGYPLRFKNVAWRPLLVVFALVLRLMAPLLDRGIPYLWRHKLVSRKIYI